MIGMGFVKNWEGMVGLRLALGVLEAGEYSSVSQKGKKTVLLTR
jgi:hypothetical protein